MITEDYVSFEVAKLLKEKGFNEPCMVYYTTSTHKGHEVHYDVYNPCNNDLNIIFCNMEFGSLPTHQMAMKWLRKEHNILLFLLPAQENGKLVYLVEVWTWNEEEGIYESTYAPMSRKEPEQAIEAALKYTLENLI